MFRDLCRVLWAVPRVEWGRRHDGPLSLTATFRCHGARTSVRTPEDRSRLRRIIGAVDARLPGGPNCYRRSLLEMFLDAGAAAEPLHLGLRAHGGPQSGHAWLGQFDVPAVPYEVQLDV
jgi:hypothetical protein